MPPPHPQLCWAARTDTWRRPRPPLPGSLCWLFASHKDTVTTSRARPLNQHARISRFLTQSHLQRLFPQSKHGHIARGCTFAGCHPRPCSLQGRLFGCPGLESCASWLQELGAAVWESSFPEREGLEGSSLGCYKALWGRVHLSLGAEPGVGSPALLRRCSEDQGARVGHPLLSDGPRGVLQ